MTGLEARESAVVVVISEVAVVVIITSSVVYVCGEGDLFLLPLTWIVFTSTKGYFSPGPRVISPISHFCLTLLVDVIVVVERMTKTVVVITSLVRLDGMNRSQDDVWNKG